LELAACRKKFSFKVIRRKVKRIKFRWKLYFALQ